MDPVFTCASLRELIRTFVSTLSPWGNVIFDAYDVISSVIMLLEQNLSSGWPLYFMLCIILR